MASTEVIISLIEKGTDDVLVLPWTPKKIKFMSGGQEYIEYDIMDYGTIQQAIGVGIRSVRLDDLILPGENQIQAPWQHDNWQPPDNYQGMFSMWKYNHTVLTLIISNTPICMDITLADYDITYQDGMGDYHCYLIFQDADMPTFTISGAEPDATDGLDRDTLPNPDIYTILEDDTLWGIAECYLSDGLRWEEIYELNKEVIEEAARDNGYDDSANGWIIIPGTVIKIPSIETSLTTAGTRVILNNTPMYDSAEDSTMFTRATGVYYIYDGKEINGRYRVTWSQRYIERQPMSMFVNGYVPKEYI